jgi:pilus assembly protein Flp/PilA
MGILKLLWRDESAASAAEYALLLAIITLGLAAVLPSLASAINGAVSGAAAAINSGGGS